MSSWVVVAIPEASSNVWKVSSEKVPHMTLLYLGEQTDNSKALDIASQVEHIVKTTLDGRFYLTVDRRGILGSEEADVLFFDTYSIDRLQLLRSYLLRIPELKAAYDSVEQYPSWTPHLTLGYPNTPAKDDVGEFNGVQFDKIAFWNEDYDGFEIQLKAPYDTPVMLEMSDKFKKPDSPEDLIHYGVKGMRWGVRRDRDSKTGGELSFEEQLLALYGGVSVAAFVGLSAARFVDSGNAKKLVKNGKRFATGKFGPPEYKKDQTLSKKSMTEAELQTKVIAKINPKHPAIGTNQNCRRCTIAYEMRRRGYDVTATKSVMAAGQDAKGLGKAVGAKLGKADFGENVVYSNKAWGNVESKPAAAAILKALAREPNGSRGEVGVGWSIGGGHSVAYEIINNKPVIFDTQRAKTITTPDDWAKTYDLGVMTVAYTRLDNKALNERWLERWVRNSD